MDSIGLWLSQNMSIIIWVVIFILMVITEISTAQLVSVWFAFGAFVALGVSVAGFGVVWQVLSFVVVSGLSLWVTFKFIKRSGKGDGSHTDLQDNLVGSGGVVIEEINGVKQSGRVRVQGLDWLASTSSSHDVIELGANVVVCAVQGNRCIVERDPLL